MIKEPYVAKFDRVLFIYRAIHPEYLSLPVTALRSKLTFKNCYIRNGFNVIGDFSGEKAYAAFCRRNDVLGPLYADILNLKSKERGYTGIEALELDYSLGELRKKPQDVLAKPIPMDKITQPHLVRSLVSEGIITYADIAKSSAKDISHTKDIGKESLMCLTDLINFDVLGTASAPRKKNKYITETQKGFVKMDEEFFQEEINLSTLTLRLASLFTEEGIKTYDDLRNGGFQRVNEKNPIIGLSLAKLRKTMTRAMNSYKIRKCAKKKLLASQGSASPSNK